MLLFQRGRLSTIVTPMTPLSPLKGQTSTNTDNLDLDMSCPIESRDQAVGVSGDSVVPPKDVVESEVVSEDQVELLQSAAPPSVSVERGDEDSTHADFTFDEEPDLEMDPMSCE